MLGTGNAGAGRLTLSGINTYTGGTTINGGTLYADGPSSATGSGSVTVSGGTLAGIGQVAGAVTLSSGTVAPGDAQPSYAALSLGSTFTQAGGTLAIAVGTTGNSQLQVSGAATLGGSLAVTFANGSSPTTATSYTLLTATSISGTYGSAVSVSGLTPSTGWSIVYNSTSVVLDVAPLTLTPTTLSNGTYGSAFTELDFAAGGGTAPYSFEWTMAAGSSLPPGLSLSTSGALTGTPTAAGTYSFTITATDAHGAAITQNYSLTINKAVGTIVFDATSFTYNGAQQSVTAHIKEETATTCSTLIGPNASSYPNTTVTCTGTNYNASGSTTATVTQASSTSSLASPCMTTFVENQPFTSKATVDGVNASGSIAFIDDQGATLCSNVALSSGASTCTSSALMVPSPFTQFTYHLTGNYSGDGNYKPSTTNALTVNVLSAADVVFRNGFEVQTLSCPIE